MIKTYQLGDNPQFIASLGRVAFTGDGRAITIGNAAGVAVVAGAGRSKLVGMGLSVSSSTADAASMFRIAIVSEGLQYTMPTARLHYSMPLGRLN